jgi:membrane protease YdiL (CAAX protease family)
LEGVPHVRKLVVSVCLLLGGLAIFLLGNPYFSVFPTNGNTAYYVALTLFFLLVSLALKRSQSLSRYGAPAYALFIGSAALLFLSTGILNIRMSASSAVQNIALDKVSQFLHVVPVILALTLVARDDLKSIFVAKGNLKAGLIFGGVSFVAFGVAGFALQSASGGFPAMNASSVALVLVFVFANAIMEELWIRAIFLIKYEAVIGRVAAILVTSAVFGSSHFFATYEFPGGPMVFAIVVFVLGAVGAYSMYKTESLVGAVLFHAGYDLMVIVPVLDTV